MFRNISFNTLAPLMYSTPNDEKNKRFRQKLTEK